MASKYDILHVTSAHQATDGRIFYKEARTAQELGFRVGVVGDHPKAETLHGVDIIPIRKHPVRLLRRLLGPISLLRVILREKAPVVHFHDPEIIPVGLFLQLLGYKVVYDVHEYYSIIQANRVSAGPLRALARTLARLLLETIPCALFHRSVFPTNKLREAVAPGRKSVSLVNLLPKAMIPDERDKAIKDHDLVFMGTISPFRAGPLMEMMGIILKERPDAKLLMLGTKAPTVRWMRANAPSQHVLDAITFHPRVPHSEVFSVLSRAKIGFNYHPMEPQFEVAIPMKIYEYMACRLPVVTTRFPEVGDQFENGTEIIMHTGTDQAVYAEAVLDLLRHPDKAREIGTAGFDALRERVNWDTSEVPKLNVMYSTLLGQALKAPA